MQQKILLLSNQKLIKINEPITPTIPGAILIFSCNKYLETRLKEFKLPKKDYIGWKVFNIIGNPFLESEYIIHDNLITIKCEDSYIHLLKKVVMAFKIILSLYNISEGILRCGDDLIFDETKLVNFLEKKDKKDYMGYIYCKDKFLYKKKDNFMVKYFNNHPNDLIEKINGINYTLEEMQKFNEIPGCNYVGGVVVYFSVKSCNLLIYHLEKIKWNIFTMNKDFGYPYIIEDVGVGFILNNSNIYPESYNLYKEKSTDKKDNFKEAFAYHTNKYK